MARPAGLEPQPSDPKQNVVVDFNDELEVVLKDMYARRLPDSDCMFPSTREDENVGSLRATFEKVREEAGLPNLHLRYEWSGFYDHLALGRSR